jgi:TfoX/Sxy family transcriptional regulator of competence genes
MAGSSWKKSPPELVAAFGALVTRHPELRARKMFGYPAAFVGGHMTTALHQEHWIVRLPAEERAELLAAPGASPFEPMPGRPMREYVVLPGDVVADAGSLDDWVDRAIAYARTLPPKG